MAYEFFLINFAYIKFINKFKFGKKINKYNKYLLIYLFLNALHACIG